MKNVSKAIIIPIIISTAIISLFLIYVACVQFTGLLQYPYTFWHTAEQIDAVEICNYDEQSQTFITLKALNESEQTSILSDISQLTHQKQLGGNVYFGEIVVRITYKDDSVECIGLWGTGRMKPNGKWLTYTDSFEKSEFSKMLLKYINEDLVPEKYREWAAESLSN